jgi:uncharacterized phage protein (TIGR01671 family)
MNDRFKFRAWWKPNYRKPIMLYDVEKTYDFMRGEPESICADCFGEVLEDEDYIVMQCTGLKDKNGKLIYEGDIIKETLTDFINEEIITVVKWDKLNATYNLENSQNCEREVIGNIYENKSLLESEG